MNINKREFIKGVLMSGIAGSVAASGFPLMGEAAAKAADGDIPLIPTPHKIRTSKPEFRLENGGKITYDDPRIENIVRVFKERLRPFSDIKLESQQLSDTDASKGAVHLEIGRTPEIRDVPKAQGLSPAIDADLDERYFLRADKNGVVIKAPTPEGLSLGLTTLLQILMTAPQKDAAGISVASVQIADGPHYKWRSFHIDLARQYFTPEQVKTVIDLIAFYKFNAIDLHLTDDAAWRIEATRPEGKQPDDEPFYTRAELNEIVKYAQDRFITAIPSSDAPGHATALIKLHPELAAGNNVQQFEIAPGLVHRSAWLNPDLPASFKIYEEVVSYLADVFPGRWLDIGGDEAFGMPEDLYTKFVRHQHKTALATGKKILACQETMRAGLDHDLVVQFWISPEPKYANTQYGTQFGSAQAMQLQKIVVANVENGKRDIQHVIERELPVLLTPFAHTYLDVPYKEASLRPEQNEMKAHLGLRTYQPQTIEGYYDWNPAKTFSGKGKTAQIAGIGAAIWCETINSFNDLTFLVLPRLPGMAQKGWSTVSNSPWLKHSAALPAHGAIWEKSNLDFFRSDLIMW